MERPEGESPEHRVVQEPEFETTREVLPRQMAQELAAIHDVPIERLPLLPSASGEPAAPQILEDLEEELDLLEEPHPPIEFGLHWLREHPSC